MCVKKHIQKVSKTSEKHPKKWWGEVQESKGIGRKMLEETSIQNIDTRRHAGKDRTLR